MLYRLVAVHDDVGVGLSPEWNLDKRFVATNDDELRNFSSEWNF